MDTKEAIDFINENILDFKERTKDEELFDKDKCKIFIKKAEEVVLSLQNGEKYEQIWEKLKEYFKEMAKSENWKHEEYSIFGLNHFNMMNNLEQNNINEEGD